MLLKKLLCVVIMMLVAMSCVLFFNHYDLLTGMVPKTWDCALYTEMCLT